MSQTPAIRVADTPEALSDIHLPDCAAAIWPREPLHSFQVWINSLEPRLLPKARTILRPDRVHDAASAICDVCGTPDSAERALLIGDIAALADIFASLMDTSYLMMRLDVVTSHSCRKFHSDASSGRLICTYRGTGTQYGISKDGADPGQVFTAPTCAPILLRGSRSLRSSGPSLLHRSPPIETTDETRLVLVLDPVDGADAPPNRNNLN